MKRTILTFLFIALMILSTACASSSQSAIEATTIPAETTSAPTPSPTPTPTPTPTPSPTPTPMPTPTPEPTLSIDEKASSYPKGEYEDYARNPDTYAFQTVQITGSVIQVVEGDDVIVYRVMTDDMYEQVWYVEYTPVPSESRILQDDSVTIYGIYYGIYSYESVMGGNISVPAIYAENVILQ